MSRISVLVLIALAFAGAMGLSGCVPKNAYQYADIKNDYSDFACMLDPSRAADPAKASCAINSKLSLKDILAIAKANNPDMLMAMARIERARAMLKKSAAPFYPQVNVYTEYLQGDAPIGLSVQNH